MFYLMLMFSFLILMTSCIQEADIEEPTVFYTINVRETNSTVTLDSVLVEITDNKMTFYHKFTDSSGKVAFPAIVSSLNQIIVSKPGYTTADTVDRVIIEDSLETMAFRVITFELTSDSALQWDNDLLKDKLDSIGREIDTLNTTTTLEIQDLQNSLTTLQSDSSEIIDSVLNHLNLIRTDSSTEVNRLFTIIDSLNNQK
ncbi:MAG: hypothetical protein OCD01_05555 [Fibrobacterales bacterium]